MFYSIKLSILILCFCTVISFGHSARILGVFSSIGRSHTLLGATLLKSLAQKGHDVTIITYFPENKNITNYREIVIENDLRSIFYDDTNQNAFEMQKNFGFRMVFNFLNKSLEVSDAVLSDNNVQKLLKSKEHFDAVIVVAFLSEALYSIANHFNAPLIVFSTIGPSSLTDDLVGNPSPYAYVPDAFMFSQTGKMTFLQRALNTFASTMGELYRNLLYYPGHEKLRQKYFPNLPSVYDIMKNTSLLLLSSHVSIEIPRPLVPNTIEIGGFHVLDPKPLPSDLQKFLDEAKDGVIYFSLGSNVQSKDMPIEMKNTIVEILSKLKQRVLWKWEDDVLPGKPKNVEIRKWFPQTDILAHPNVKLFITHGGRGGTTEAIVRGVPFVGIPVFGDQQKNLEYGKQNGLGVVLTLDNITSESFSWAINEVLNNPVYRENIKEKSKQFLDREIKPLDRARYWIEYVIRHKGAKHLRSPALDLCRTQLLLLDVIAFMLAIVISVLCILYFIIKLCYKLILKIYRKITTKKDLKKNLKHKKQQ